MLIIWNNCYFQTNLSVISQVKKKLLKHIKLLNFKLWQSSYMTIILMGIFDEYTFHVLEHLYTDIWQFKMPSLRFCKNCFRLKWWTIYIEYNWHFKALQKNALKGWLFQKT